MKHNTILKTLAAAPYACTATDEHRKPLNKGRRGEKDLEKLRRAEQKRERRAAKRKGK